MNDRRPPKKSETLEVRVPHEVKDALMRKARAEGRSASDVVRTCIVNYLDGERKEASSMFVSWRPAAAAGALGVAVLWLALAPAPAGAGPDFRAAFEHFDQNHDRLISLDEFLSRNTDTLFINRADRPADRPIAKKFTLPIGHKVPSPLPGASHPSREMLQSEFALEDRENGSVSFEEFEAYHRQMLHDGFATVDGDHDGTLDPTEYRAAIAAAPGDGAARFDDLDANHDGRITEEEFFS
jgi:Ca2+-binding EF-hand superfamily protein